MEKTFIVIGNPTKDVIYSAQPGEVKFGPKQVCICVDEQMLHIPYSGPQIRAGDKCTVACNLDGLVEKMTTRATVCNGGGVRNTILHMASQVVDNGWPVILIAFDPTQPWLELEAEYRSAGIQHITLALEEVATNLIIVTEDSND